LYKVENLWSLHPNFACRPTSEALPSYFAMHAEHKSKSKQLVHTKVGSEILQVHISHLRSFTSKPSAKSDLLRNCLKAISAFPSSFAPSKAAPSAMYLTLLLFQRAIMRASHIAVNAVGNGVSSASATSVRPLSLDVGACQLYHTRRLEVELKLCRASFRSPEARSRTGPCGRFSRAFQGMSLFRNLVNISIA
jgi:hypothetical protein